MEMQLMKPQLVEHTNHCYLLGVVSYGYGQRSQVVWQERLNILAAQEWRDAIQDMRHWTFQIETGNPEAFAVLSMSDLENLNVLLDPGCERDTVTANFKEVQGG